MNSYFKKTAWLLLPGKWCRYTFPLSITVNPGHYIYGKHKKTLKEEKTDFLETFGPEKQHGGKFPGFSFSPIQLEHEQRT